MQSYNAGISTEEQIGQVMVAGFFGLTVPPEIIDLIQNRYVGNIILFSRNISSPQQLRGLTEQLQSIARQAGQRYPLLIMLDQENGMVRRLGQGATIFPGNMTLGAVGSEQLTYDVALASGRELKALGVNMNLAPDIDVNNNPANPVIGVRSFGEDPQLVARLGEAAVKGYSAAGVLTSVKHFPGHGDTTLDSHLALPVVPYTLERLEQIELVPFRSAMKAGASTVMIAHMYLPAIMKQAMLPSTISSEIVKGLLRGHLGYAGVVISDCLEMRAVADTIGIERGAVLALQAGIDLILISHHYQYQLGAITAIKTALQEGALAPQVLEQAAERVIEMKQRFLSWDETRQDISVVGSQEHAQLSRYAYEQSTTLVRDEAHLLPLHLEPEQSLLILLPLPTIHDKVSDRQHIGSALIEYVRQHHSNVQIRVTSAQDTAEAQDALQQALAAAVVTLVVTHNAHLDPWQTAFVRGLL